MHFKAAGLGDRSAREAARLLFETGVSFESAAVLGQCAGEPVAAVAKVREEADRYRRVGEGPRRTSAWGRSVAEAQPVDSRPAEAHGRGSSSAVTTQVVQPDKRTINGVEHHVVHEYTPVQKPAAGDLEESGPRRSAWGRRS